MGLWHLFCLANSRYAERERVVRLCALFECAPSHCVRFSTARGLCTVKKVIVFPVPSRDVTNQTLPGRELLNYSWPGRVWLGMTYRLGMGKTITVFLQCGFFSFTDLGIQPLIRCLARCWPLAEAGPEMTGRLPRCCRSGREGAAGGRGAPSQVFSSFAPWSGIWWWRL